MRSEREKSSTGMRLARLGLVNSVFGLTITMVAWSVAVCDRCTEESMIR
jgi:hypothetical protein